jgi:hypothetical protein
LNPAVDCRRATQYWHREQKAAKLISMEIALMMVKNCSTSKAYPAPTVIARLPEVDE